MRLLLSIILAASIVLSAQTPIAIPASTTEPQLAGFINKYVRFEGLLVEAKEGPAILLNPTTEIYFRQPGTITSSLDKKEDSLMQKHIWVQGMLRFRKGSPSGHDDDQSEPNLYFCLVEAVNDFGPAAAK